MTHIKLLGDAGIFALAGANVTGVVLTIQAAPGFQDVTEAAGLRGVGGNGFSALFFEYDGDTRPDLLVASYSSWELSLERLLSPARKAERDTPRLFRNLGSGQFREVTAEAGLTQAYSVMQAAAADVDADGWTDLVLALGGPDREGTQPGVVLRNLQGKTFIPWLHLPGFDRPANSAGVAASDMNGDGRPDLYLAGAGLLRSIR